MVRRGTIVSAMAAHLPTGRGSPVSIHGLPVLRTLEETLRSEGFEWVSLPDFDPGRAGLPVIGLWDFGSLARLPRSVQDAADGRVVAWSLESPLVAHRGYHHLPKMADQVAHVIGYPGVGELVANRRANFHAVGWPNTLHDPVPGGSWETRDLLVMINSNKRLHQWLEGFGWSRLQPWARLVSSSLIANSYPCRRQWQVPDLYNERLRVIEELGGHPDFSLFGVGWDNRLPGWSADLWEKVNKSYRGEVADKRDTLRRFRFALCVENTVFPGYISEKIFDAMLAKTIPIYLGAPDIDHYIPEGAFIDLRRFSEFGEVIDFISSMGADDAQQHLAAAKGFLTSDEPRCFTEEHFFTTMSRAVRTLLPVDA